jgi:Holliday junction resolvasome RuvABC ATP-dependent DNA helicase subunit
MLLIGAYRNIRSACEKPNSPFGPVILSGPPGSGKTLTAQVLHYELGNTKFIETNGETLNDKRELLWILVTADEDTTILIDEAQGLNARAQHILLTALSEGNLYVPGPMRSAPSRTIRLAKFTMILATTHEYLLQDALRNRMRVYCRFNYYAVQDLVQIVRQRADMLGWRYESEEVLQIIAQRAKGTPRLALHRNLQTCWHVAKSRDRDVITLEDVHEAFYHLQIDELGLDQLDRSYLAILQECGQLRLGVLSSKLSLPGLTIQRQVEPYLVREGFITKDGSSARAITEKGRRHIEGTSCPSQWRKDNENVVR